MSNPVILGAIVMACLVITVFFLRYWRRTGDRLLVMFAAAFFLLAANWAILSFVDDQDERRPYLYLMRAAAFVLIIVGIVDKNRAVKRSQRRGLSVPAGEK
jgi:O-antigen/teichoic acid export membrane protein